jgi:hypothetical protein
MIVIDGVVGRTRDRVCDHRDRRVQLTEADTIRVLVLPVLEALGWDLQDVEEVRSEYPIKDRSDSAAKVVDGKRVEFRGEVISFNDWGCRSTGWSAIQIYRWAVLPDGRLLEALREGAE